MVHTFVKDICVNQFCHICHICVVPFQTKITPTFCSAVSFFFFFPGKNSAAAGLCNWVVNIVIYRDIVVTVEPKRIALAKASEELKIASDKLDIVQKRVKELNAKLKKLTDEYDEANKTKQEAIATVEAGQKKLGLANRLINALASENVRWALNVKSMEADFELLVGDVLLASAFISYIGPFTKRFRAELLEVNWVPFLQTAAGGESIPMSADPRPRTILTNDAEVAQWNQDELPSDPVSVENGCIVTNSMRFPLLIDPQLQGLQWIKQKEAKNGLQVIRMNQKGALRKLEQAMENGSSLLIENLGESIDAILNPVISRATVKKGRRLFIKLGDSEVEFHPNFKLFLHTKLSNPHYPPEIQAEAALVNFSVTEDGLEDQLLAMVVEQERPDLATQRLDLISQQNGFLIKMQQLEDDILHRLSTAEGDLTTNVDLIEGLETTKAVSVEINNKSIIANEMSAKINVISEKYRSAAARGSILFFLMNNLFKTHTFYVFSLAAYVVVFLRGITLTGPPEKLLMNLVKAPDGSPLPQKGGGEEEEEEEEEEEDALPDMGGEEDGESEDPDMEAIDEAIAKRCKDLIGVITTTTWKYLRRGLFVTNKLTIATQLCFKTMIKDGLLDADMVDFLIMANQTFTTERPATLWWLPVIAWNKIKFISKFSQFKELPAELEENSEQWRRWFDEQRPETVSGKQQTREEILLVETVFFYFFWKIVFLF